MYLYDICTHRLNELLETKSMWSKRRFRKKVRYNGNKLIGKIPRAERKNMEVLLMNSRENLPMMISANDIQTMGFTRTMAYNILNREDVPVVKIGSRKFIQRDKFFDWLDSREKDEIVNDDGRADR